MSWATLPDPAESAALRDGLARHDPATPMDHHLLHMAVRALLLQPAPPPAHRASGILQFWDQPQPPPDVLDCMDSWRAAGPPLVRFDDAAARDWLQARFGAELVAAYRHCHHPAMRCDLFRLAWLLREGGLYVDADDALAPDALMQDFGRGAVLLPLAQQGHAIVPVLDGLHARNAGQYIGFYVNNAPFFARPGHPLLERALERAMGHLRQAMAEGRRADIHIDVGPTNLSFALLDHLAECHRQDRDPDVHVQIEWPWLRPFLPLAYKQGERNWRSGASLG